MKKTNGMTLVEIMMAIAIMGFIAKGVMSLIKTSSDITISSKQSSVIKSAATKLQNKLSVESSCAAIIASPTSINLTALKSAAGPLGSKVSIVAATPLPISIAAIAGNSTNAYTLDVLVHFNKINGTATKKTVKRVSARLLYENNTAASAIPSYKKCIEYEDQATRAAFEYNCKSIGGKFVDSNNFDCDISNLDSTSPLLDAIGSDICQTLFGVDSSSYNSTTKKCNDIVISNTGLIASSNVGNGFIALNGNKRTTFDQTSCSGPNEYIYKININGAVECATVSYCIPGSTDCPVTEVPGSLKHCQTGCSCSLSTQAQNDAGPGTGSPKNLCPSDKINDPKCLPKNSSYLPGGGTLLTGQYTSDFVCKGLNCRYKDYLTHTGTNSYSTDSYVTFNVHANLSQAGTCAVTNTYTKAAGLCQRFNSTTVTNYTTKYKVGHSNGSFSGLNFNALAAIETAPNGSSCGPSGVCTNGICVSATVNGVCGPSHDLCNTGTSSNPQSDSTSYTWQCLGSGGGSTANCSELKITNGICAGTHYNCAQGTTINNISTANEYTWKCSGINGGTTANCSEQKIINGICSSTHYSCTQGTSTSNVSASTQYTWKCSGINGGTTASCSEPKTTGPTCGSTKNSCIVGTYGVSSGEGTASGSYRWKCFLGTVSKYCYINCRWTPPSCTSSEFMEWDPADEPMCCPN